MILVFDVDGTLIGGEEQDWPSFDEAIRMTIGFQPNPAFWAALPEVTARAIVQQACQQVELEWTHELEDKVCKRYLENLRQAAPFKKTVFLPKPGVLETLELLKSTGVFGVAIATGDFGPTSRFKLASAGVPFQGLAYACSSDHAQRHEIIKLAVERAGYEIEDAIYIGDGTWDLKACELLDIPFIGTGSRKEALTGLGARVVEDLSPGSLLPLVRSII
jgi:phosphoglycolate phosphatase-like HAD superfamily hydrolase